VTDHACPPAVADAYHRWYYDSGVWAGLRFLGVPCYKSAADMWSYQEILTELRPALVVEFGTRFGGAALFFSVLGRAINPQLRVLSVDVSHDDVAERVREDASIELLTASSTADVTASRIAALRQQLPGPAFFILDSDHSAAHVLAELELLRPLAKAGDYVVVEDGNINGNPVLPDWGPGPSEAIAEYLRCYPGDYCQDSAREQRFGFTFAPGGFLCRQ
jgi:cephalosporin hydroxylase